MLLEAWICCALVLSNLTHSMNLYLEATISMLSHWFTILEAGSSQTDPFWLITDFLACSTSSAWHWACPIHSQSFCIHQLPWSALSEFHCPGQVQPPASSSCRCQLKCTAPCSLSEKTRSWEFFWVHHSEFPSNIWMTESSREWTWPLTMNQPWFLSSVPWLQIHLYFTFFQV